MGFAVREIHDRVWPGAPLRIPRFALAAIILFAAGSGFGQQQGDFAGDYVGLYAGREVYVHVKIGPDGSVSANIDNPAANLFNVPCSDVSINGAAFSFSVPSLRGEWTGLMSADHKSLSGVWKQGKPMALNFARTTESGKGAQALGSTPFPSGTPVTVATPQRPACTTQLGPSYWDGGGWAPMVSAAHLGGARGLSYKEALKNPFSYSSGVTRIVLFKDTAAALTLDPNPTFCIVMSPNANPTAIMIGTIDVRGDHRVLESCAGRCASKGSNSDDWMPQKRVQPVEIRRVSSMIVEITMKGPLPVGQYVLGGTPMTGYFDFGVSAAKATR